MRPPENHIVYFWESELSWIWKCPETMPWARGLLLRRKNIMYNLLFLDCLWEAVKPTLGPSVNIHSGQFSLAIDIGEDSELDKKNSALHQIKEFYSKLKPGVWQLVELRCTSCICASIWRLFVLCFTPCGKTHVLLCFPMQSIIKTIPHACYYESICIFSIFNSIFILVYQPKLGQDAINKTTLIKIWKMNEWHMIRNYGI